MNQKKRKASVNEEISDAKTFVSLTMHDEIQKKLAEAQELVRSLQDKISTTEAENKSLKADNKSLEGKLSKSEALVKTLQEKDQPIDEDNDDDDDSVLDPSDPWVVKFKKLREYRAINGDCKVPMKYTLNPKLGTWVNNQKLNYANTKMGKKWGKNF
jgi:predicted nuclease with TOPRIM domain